MIRTFIGVLFLAAAILLSRGTVGAQEEDPWTPADEEEHDRYIKEQVERYVKLFGKLSVFTLEKKNADFVRSLRCVNPQPKSAFLDIGDKVIDPRLLKESQSWIDRFLHEPFRPRPVEKSPPELYYLPKLRGERQVFDVGLLLHEWKTNKYRFTMYEGASAILLRVAPLDYKAGDTLPAKRLAGIVREVLHHDYFAGNEQWGKVVGYGSDEEFIKAFRLPDQVGPGVVFHQLRFLSQVSSPGMWPDSLVGFISDGDICLVCHKSINSGALAELFQRNPVWLNRGLFEKDGKTLVAPVSPKIPRG